MMTPIPAVLAEVLSSKPEPQGSFPWHRDRWRVQMHDLPEVLVVLDRLPDRVDRQSTRDVVLSELAAGRTLPAFVSAMIWGWGTTGMGPLRTRWVLTEIEDRSRPSMTAPLQATVAHRLEAGVEAVRDKGPLGAFKLMNNTGGIKHFGPSYFTKWLYFSSALDGPDDDAAAPILDKQISRWLREHADIQLNPNRTSSYSEYLDLLAGWGTQHGRTRVQVEKVIFKLATARG